MTDFKGFATSDENGKKGRDRQRLGLTMGCAREERKKLNWVNGRVCPGGKLGR